MQPRAYQLEAVEAVDSALRVENARPCIVLPTGAGKSPVIAWTIQRFAKEYPPLRTLVLAHVQELVQQNADKMRIVWPEARIGIYSAGLGSRDMNYRTTFASIQSIWKRACDFDPFDLIIIDEAHLIPLKNNGMYRKFLADAKLVNPHVCIVGFTATAYRLDGGIICGPEFILSHVAYEANVKDLIEQGYLCRLRSKAGDASANVANVHTQKGEFVTSELMGVVTPLVQKAVGEAVSMLVDRKSVLFFGVTVEHANQISLALSAHGFYAPVIHAGTPAGERASLIQRFTAGELRGLCNVNVLTTGFDAQRVDAIVMLRPTQSPGLYYQMVGRGLRTHESKSDVLVLDFAGNIARHGPIDCVKGHKPGTQRCLECKEIFSKAATECPACGWYLKVACPNCETLVRFGTAQCTECKFWIIGKDCRGEDCGVRNPMTATICINCHRPFPRLERDVEHDTKASAKPILSSDKPWEVPVKKVLIEVHEKPGKPPSLKVTYRGDLESHREWICLEHTGSIQYRARKWWERRFGAPVPTTIAEATGGLFGLRELEKRLTEITEFVRVRQSGKYTEVIDWGLKNGVENYRAFTN